jgi:PST family polysaccharide transporter
MNLVKTSLLNGLAVAIRLGTSVALNKVLAVYVGPAGFGVIGQFQSFVAMLGNFAGGAFNTGVTKYTAEYHDDNPRQQAVWRTAATMGLLGSACLAVPVLVFRESIAVALLADASLASVFGWLSLSLLLMAMNGLMMAILNGRKAVSAYVAANVVGGLFSAGVAMTAVVHWGLYGALLSTALSQPIACGITAWFFQRALPIPWRSFVGRVDSRVAQSLGGYALMTATSAIVVPFSQIAIRDGLVRMHGWEMAGLWQAMWRISETHLMLLTTTLSLYFLPRFSEIREGDALRAEVRRCYQYVLPIVLTSAAAIFVFRELLIATLLSRKFLPMSDALAWNLLGDILKIASWITAFTMISHARTSLFVASEIAASLLLVGSVLALAGPFGLIGAAMGYGVTYAIYWIVMHWSFCAYARTLGTLIQTRR